MVTWLMQSTLPHLVARCQPFSIPTSHKGIEVLLEARKNPRGVVLASVHLPFVRMVFRCLSLEGELPTAVIAGREAIVNGRLPIEGMAESIPAIVANRNVLIKVRRILRRGGFVATLVDAKLGDQLNYNMFRLIRSIGASLVFVTTELRPDGVIAVEFFRPPDPLCRNDESVLSNLRVLESRRAQILQFCSAQQLITTVPIEGDVQRRIVDLDLTSCTEKLDS